MRAELQARIIEQETHLRSQAREELMLQRAERLEGEIEALRRQLAERETELVGLRGGR